MIVIRKSCSAPCCLLAIAACFAALPALAAEGDCLGWNVSGSWHLAQSNGPQVLMRLQQTDTNLQGVAEYSQYNNDSGKVQTIAGPVYGALERGQLVRVTVFWNNSTAGRYVGQVMPDGGMDGYAVDQNDASNKATFRASGYPTCLAREAAAPPSAAPAMPTVKALGRVRIPGQPATSSKSICEAAVSARARNSPAAPGLEAQCAAQPSPVAAEPSVDAAQLDALAARPAPVASAPSVDAAQLDALAAQGALSGTDPLLGILRARQAEGAGQRGFDIGVAATGEDTEPGPGKRRIRDSLGSEEQRGFDAALTFSLERNRNKALAATGAAIAAADPSVDAMRTASPDVFYQLGFDIATGLFGDPALGAAGNTQMGPGSASIRGALNAAGQRGFDDAVKFHTGRTYR